MRRYVWWVVAPAELAPRPSKKGMIAWVPVPGPKPNSGRSAIALRPVSHRQSRASKEEEPFSWTVEPAAAPDEGSATHGWLRVLCWTGPLGLVEPGLWLWPRCAGLGLRRTLAALGPYQAVVRSTLPSTPMTLVIPPANTISITTATATAGRFTGEVPRLKIASAPQMMSTISHPSRL